MNLIIDAGNTKIKWAIYSGEKQIFKNVCGNWDEFRLDDCFLQFPKITAVIISSVRIVPDEILGFLKEIGSNFYELNHKLHLPIKLLYKTPETLGKDRISAAAGASSI